MHTKLWFRASAAILFCFALGHTIGFLSFVPSTNAGKAVWSAMTTVYFQENGTSYSYGNFYLGFGLFVSMFYVLLGVLAWFLSMRAEKIPREARSIAWCLCVSQLGATGLSVAYFSLAPIVLASLATITLGMAALRISTNHHTC
jgi:hypothetical protein